MFQRLNEESISIGLKMNLDKIKVMTKINYDGDIRIDDTVIGRVESTSSHKLKLGWENQNRRNKT